MTLDPIPDELKDLKKKKNRKSPNFHENFV